MVIVLVIGLFVAVAFTAMALASSFVKVAFIDGPWQVEPLPTSEVHQATTTPKARAVDPTRRVIATVYESACQAMTNSIPSPTALSACPGSQLRSIGVTPLEVLVMVEEIQRRQTDAEIKTIRATAKANVERMSHLTSQQIAEGKFTCPLMGSEGCCLAFESRPQQCQACCREGDEAVLSTSDLRMSRGIRAHGLDGNVYELNHALVVALDTGDAAERWSRGERAFENCRPYA